MDHGIVFEENRIENAKKKKNDVDHSKLMKNLASIKQAINDAGFEHDDVPGKVFAHIKDAHQSIHRAINALTPHMQNGDDMHPSDVDMDDPRKANANNPFELYEDKPGWEKASQVIMGAIDANKSFDEVMDIAEGFRRFGADDTASRDAIFRYMKRKGKSVASKKFTSVNDDDLQNRKDPAEELDAIGFPPKKKEKNADPKHKEGDGVVYGDDHATILHVIPGSPNKYEIKIAGGETVTVREDQLA